MLSTILFDFDGTIADTFEPAIDILYDMADKYHYPKVDKEEITKMRSLSMKEVCDQLHVPLWRLPFIAAELQGRLYAHMEQIPAFKGMPEALERLKGMGYRLGIVSSNNQQNIQRFLKAQHIDVFDAIYSETSIFGKARVIRGFLQKYHVQKDHVVYVGDEMRDIEAAKQVGVPMIAVTWGLNLKTSLEKLHPEFIADSPKELIDVIKSYNT